MKLSSKVLRQFVSILIRNECVRRYSRCLKIYVSIPSIDVIAYNHYYYYRNGDFCMHTKNIPSNTLMADIQKLQDLQWIFVSLVFECLCMLHSPTSQKYSTTRLHNNLQHKSNIDIVHIQIIIIIIIIAQTIQVAQRR